MRRAAHAPVAAPLAFLFALGTGAPAWATDAPKDKEAKSAKDSSTPGGGGPAGGAGGVGLQTQPEGRWGGMVDLRRQGKDAPKPWEIGAIYQLQGIIARQGDGSPLMGTGARLHQNFFFLYGRMDVTRNNRLTLRGGFTEGSLIDQGDSPVRLGDVALAYTRSFPLPHEFLIQATVSTVAPTGYYSQRASLITAPALSLSVSKSVRGFYVGLRGFGQYFFYKCSTPAASANYAAGHGYDCSLAGANGTGGNTRYELSLTVDASYSFWFHRNLSIGADVLIDWTRSVAIDNGGPIPTNGSGGVPELSVADNTAVAHPPIQQSYGGEVYVRYSVPPVKGVKLDLAVALNYNQNLIHDGIAYVYPVPNNLATLRALSMYGSVTLRY